VQLRRGNPHRPTVRRAHRSRHRPQVSNIPGFTQGDQGRFRYLDEDQPGSVRSRPGNLLERDAPTDERNDRLAEAVERLSKLGASPVEKREQRGDSWIVMQDPEGNEFCLQ
jgi:hypothetical protein